MSSKVDVAKKELSRLRRRGSLTCFNNSFPDDGTENEFVAIGRLTDVDAAVWAEVEQRSDLGPDHAASLVGVAVKRNGRLVYVYDLEHYTEQVGAKLEPSAGEVEGYEDGEEYEEDEAVDRSELDDWVGRNHTDIEGYEDGPVFMADFQMELLVEDEALDRPPAVKTLSNDARS